MISSRLLHGCCRSLRRITNNAHLLNPRPVDVKVTNAIDLCSLFEINPNPFILDVRDPDEVSKGKGGPPGTIDGSINVPLNHDGVGQRERLTTLDEFRIKLREQGIELPSNKEEVIITHCGSGGRGGKAAALLQQAGYQNVHNGGGPVNIAAAAAISADKARTTNAS